MAKFESIFSDIIEETGNCTVSGTSTNIYKLNYCTKYVCSTDADTLFKKKKKKKEEEKNSFCHS